MAAKLAAARMAWSSMEERAMAALNIGLLVFPQVQQLDLTGPYEVFASIPGARVRLVWKSLEPIISATGLVLIPDTLLTSCPSLDVLCVPGGVGVNALMEDAEVLAFLRHQAITLASSPRSARGRWCWRPRACSRAGGRRPTGPATTFLPAWVRCRRLRGWCTDGRFTSGGGVTAGIDMALTIAAELVGQPQAEAIQLNLEYAPAPPFDAGRPETASTDVVAVVRAKGSVSRAERERIVQRLEAARASCPR